MKNNRFKFRVWDKKDNKFIDDEDLCYSPRQNLVQWDFYYEYYRQSRIVPKQAVIQWSTGLKDANKNDIYEGDIIKHEFPWKHEFPEDKDNITIVRWTKEGEDNHPGFKIWDLFTQGGKMSVIGNIFENPELKP